MRDETIEKRIKSLPGQFRLRAWDLYSMAHPQKDALTPADDHFVAGLVQEGWAFEEIDFLFTHSRKSNGKSAFRAFQRVDHTDHIRHAKKARLFPV